MEGFTLLEVLVTLVIMSLGLLGLAGLQLRSLQAGNDSFSRSQAMILAYDMADRMRANPQAAGNGDYLVAPDDLPAAPAYDCQTSFPTGKNSCAPDELASADLTSWVSALTNNSVLPQGTASITCDDVLAGDGVACSPNSVHTVILMWDEARTGATGTGCSDNFQVDRQCLAIELAL